MKLTELKGWTISDVDRDPDGTTRLTLWLATPLRPNIVVEFGAEEAYRSEHRATASLVVVKTKTVCEEVREPLE